MGAEGLPRRQPGEGIRAGHPGQLHGGVDDALQALRGEIAGGGAGRAAAGRWILRIHGEEDPQAESARAGLGELLHLAQADVGVKLLAADHHRFGVAGAQSKRTLHRFSG